MREIAVSRFKATCLGLLEEIHRTGVPVRVTRFGKPLVDVAPAAVKKEGAWLGSMAARAEIAGDLVAPVGALSRWKPER